MEENKFNFSEEEETKKETAAEDAKSEAAVEESKKAVKKDARGLFENIKKFLIELLDFREDTDRDETTEAIKRDISFKGATAWILVCSIFVASIGLNANSTAVVIGAMLISPLMGPILGIGLSVAVNDIDTMKRSLINLATMIVLSLLTAYLFFWLFPLSEDTSELLGRVQPDIRDVLIAFFGGAALIIAKTKRGTIASAIFGVAIATALMPPLCTAGYGLAKGNWPYFFGAMYLFIINTIFIALATFIVVKALRFPMLRYANSKRRKRTAQIASFLAIIVMVPAGFTFWKVLQESNFDTEAKRFVDNELKGLPQYEYIKKNTIPKFNDGDSYIEFNTYGLGEIPESTIGLIKSKTSDYPALANTRIIFNQSRTEQYDNMKYMEQIRFRDSVDLIYQTQKISLLEDRVKMLSAYEKNTIPFDDVIKEVKINYENLDRFSYSSEIASDFKKIDTVSVFSVKWNKDKMNSAGIAKEQDKLERWLKVKLKLDTLVVRQIN
ncbi:MULTISPECIES: TIGR00341 family protein [unclassified Bizionia]|uniref:TIGR00341 family protein n=1 Tax=unclassified Bizionia TaxID=2626393 RepID=UPI002061A0BA|nr:TIGR00341 family protein [Bizionia sp. M204]UPS91876.1 TIGR00341 family protein [Bizionia sp. M204]